VNITAPFVGLGPDDGLETSSGLQPGPRFSKVAGSTLLEMSTRAMRS
jgi:hypothetical protein